AGDRRRIRDYKVTSVKYRPGRRHVLRYDPEDPGSGETVFAKVYIGDEDARTPNRASNRFRREDGARAFRVAGEVADWLVERGLNCLRPLAYVAADAVVLYTRLCGVPLYVFARQLNAVTATYLHHAGDAGSPL